MNYRHAFHAGNFGDVLKHVLLLRLIAGMQRKEKPFLYLDTHAGIGRYDLSAEAPGRTLEFLGGIGRLWGEPSLSSSLRDYVETVRAFDRTRGGGGAWPRFYPGSPWLACERLRPQDRAALVERHPVDTLRLREEFADHPLVSTHPLDGYTSLRAMLPPPERRALVLIDPPYEAPDEFEQVHAALREALRRFPAGVYAIWYPIKNRAAVDAFHDALTRLAPPPTLNLELTLAGDEAVDRLNGCGLTILNPPWQLDRELTPILPELARLLAIDPGASSSLRWLVPE